MTPQEQRIAIAEACGWHDFRFGKLDPSVLLAELSNRGGGVVPDYLNDLNAMHEAEKVLDTLECGWSRYTEHLDVGISATAAQRAEAFLKTLGLWK